MRQVNGQAPLPFRPQLVRYGRPLSQRTLVSRPAPVKGLRSWSVELVNHRWGVHHIAWSPQGDRIATAGYSNSTNRCGGEVRLWDGQGRLLSVLPGHEGTEIRMAFSPDGKLLASCESGTHASGPSCRIWDLGKNQCVARIQLRTYGLHLAFAPQGRRLAIATAIRGPQIVDLDTHRISESGEPLTCDHIAWSPDGNTLATTVATQTVLWDAATLQRKGQVQILGADGKERRSEKTLWSPDGRWLAGYAERKVQIWDAKTLQPKQSLEHKHSIHDLQWCHDNRRLAVVGDGEVGLTIWDVPESKILVKANLDFIGLLRGIAWSPDGRELVGAPLHALMVPVFLDSSTGKEIRRGSELGLALNRSCYLSPDGKEVVSPTGRIWDAASGLLLRRLYDLPSTEPVARWSPQNRVLAYFDLDTPNTPVVVGNAQNWNDRRQLRGDGEEANIGAHRVEWSPDERWLATAARRQDSAIRIYEVRTGKLVHKLTGHEKPIYHLAWSPDGKYLASYAMGDTIRLWDPQAGKMLQTFKASHWGYRPLVWHADSRHIWFAADLMKVAMLNVITGESSPQFEQYGNNITSLTLTLSGRFLLSREAYDWTYLLGTDTKQRRALGQGLGHWQQVWHPDETRFLGDNGVGYDILRQHRLGTLIPAIHGEHWLCVGPDGHWRGSEGVHEHIVYVAQTDAGEYLTLSPAEFERRFGWRNEPEKARLLKRDP